MIGRRIMQQPPSHIPLLDGLRAFAVTCVLTEHFGGMLAEVNSWGYYGVDLFFVLSGFLITRILLAGTGRFGRDLRTFIGRRTLRIFPAYYLVVLLFWLTNYANTREVIFSLVTYTWNYAESIQDKGRPFYLWSLCVEEQFYLVWPFLVLGLRSRPRLLASVTLGLISLSYSQLIWDIIPAISPYQYTGLPNRMGSLLLGAFATIVPVDRYLPQVWYRSRRLELLLLIALLWSTASLRFEVVSFHVAAYVVAGLCSLCLIMKCTHGSFAFPVVNTVLSHRITREVGKISYGIYLLHFPVGNYFRNEIFGPIWHMIPFEMLGPLEKLRWHSWVLSFPLVCIVSFLVARLMWLGFEQPLLRLKDRWFPSHSAPVSH